MPFRFARILAIFFLAFLASPGALAEWRVALVIGNGNYPSMPLSNPVNDATDMAAMLRRAGFQVIERTDLTKKEMDRAISQFGDNLRKDSVALFYYAGHALQVKNRNYLVPVDADIKAENHVRAEAVDVDNILDQLGVSDSNIVILDACRNNPYERRFRAMGGGGLAQMDAPIGTLIAYSTAPGKTAADGEGRNGLYTQELLKQVQLYGNQMEIGNLFREVRKAVARATNNMQVPWESSSLMNAFYFFPPTQPVQAPARQGSAAVASASVSEAPRQRPATDVVAAQRVELPVAKAPVAVEGQPGTKMTMAVPAGTTATIGESPAENNTRKSVEKATDSVAMEASGKQVLRIDNSVFRGRFTKNPQTGEISGDVEIEWADNSRYTGTVVEGKYHGQGSFVWSNGQRYTGTWVHGVASGRGTLQFANGDRYEGEVQDGIMHGVGTYTLTNGDSYTGAWVEGRKHGQGRLTWANGSYWEGEFINDQYSDKGRLVDEKSAALSAAAAATPESASAPAAAPAASKAKTRK